MSIDKAKFRVTAIDRLRIDTDGKGVTTLVVLNKYNLLHNILFPNTMLHLEGISTREGEPTLVFSQPYIGGIGSAVKGEKMKYMSLLGLTKSNYGNFGNEYFTLHNVHWTTAFSIRGNLYFIDPVILFNKSPYEVFKYLLHNQQNCTI